MVGAVTVADLGDGHVWRTATAGDAGLALIEAQTDLTVGDICEIDGGSPVTFIWDGTEFLRVSPFGGTRYAATVSDYMKRNPGSMAPAWVEAEGAAAGLVDFDVTVAGKIAVLAGDSVNSSATSSKTFTGSDAAAGGFIIRDARCTTPVDNTGFRTPVKFGGTIKLANLLIFAATSAVNWTFLSNGPVYTDTGIPFGTSATLEFYFTATKVVVFKNREAEPAYSASLTMFTAGATAASWQSVTPDALLAGTTGYHFTLDAG